MNERSAARPGQPAQSATTRSSFTSTSRSTGNARASSTSRSTNTKSVSAVSAPSAISSSTATSATIATSGGSSTTSNSKMKKNSSRKEKKAAKKKKKKDASSPLEQRSTSDRTSKTSTRSTVSSNTPSSRISAQPKSSSKPIKIDNQQEKSKSTPPPSSKDKTPEPKANAGKTRDFEDDDSSTTESGDILKSADEVLAWAVTAREKILRQRVDRKITPKACNRGTFQIMRILRDTKKQFGQNDAWHAAARAKVARVELGVEKTQPSENDSEKFKLKDVPAKCTLCKENVDSQCPMCRERSSSNCGKTVCNVCAVDYHKDCAKSVAKHDHCWGPGVPHDLLYKK